MCLGGEDNSYCKIKNEWQREREIILNKKIVKKSLLVFLVTVGLFSGFLFLRGWRVYFQNGIFYYSREPMHNPSLPVVNPISARMRDFHIRNGVLFSYTGSSEHVIIPDGVTYIGQSAFIGNQYVRTVYIPQGVNTIDRYAFAHASFLEAINIPDSVTFIGDDSFYNCKSLKAIYIPDSVATIGIGAFSGCRALASVRLSENLTFISPGVFVGTALEHIKIPKGITEIQFDAFARIDSLISIQIPESVIDIHEIAFLHTNNVTIYGKSGSYAEEFANLMNIPFVEK